MNCDSRRECRRSQYIRVHQKEKSNDSTKVWLVPIVQVAESIGYNSKELQRVQDIILDHLNLLREAWNEHFTQ